MDKVLEQLVENLTHGEKKALMRALLDNMTLAEVIQILRDHYDVDDLDEISLAFEPESI